MASCECCWNGASELAMHLGGPVRYHEVIKEHEDRHCVCTKPGPEGDRARAGQFWDEKRMIDIRKDPDTPMPLPIKPGIPIPADHAKLMDLGLPAEGERRRLSDQIVEDELRRCREFLALSEDGRRFLVELKAAAARRKDERSKE